jgi:branched-subunit amino acid transport protein AzlD
MDKAIMTAATIAIIAIVTWITRGLPYLIFNGKKELPKIIDYLSSVLPASIMIILVVYCIRINITAFPYGLAELISVVVVALLQIWKKNTLVSILCGTVCYMILIRTIFPV